MASMTPDQQLARRLRDADLVDAEALAAVQAERAAAVERGELAPPLAQLLIQRELISTVDLARVLRTTCGEGPRSPGLPTTDPAPRPGDDDEVPRQLDGRYRLDAELARGGIGAVYRATDLQLDRPVAVKLLLVPTDVTQRRRLVREAEAAAQLSHPGIVGVHALGQDGGRRYLVMDLVEGPSLAQALPTLDRARRLTLFEQVTDAVAAAHAAGVIHRDLKPSNILLAPDGRAIVTDFGLARMAEGSRLTQTHAVLGTPYYMAPEQVRGQSAEAGPPADVWALGVLLYVLLTDQLPFGGTTVAEVFDRILAGLPSSPARLDRSVPAGLATICLTALQPGSARRYPDAGALADDLGRWRRGEPLTGRAPGGFSRLAGHARAHPLRAIAALTLMAAALGAAGWVANDWRMAKQVQTRVATAEAAAARGDWAAALSAARGHEDAAALAPLVKRATQTLAAEQAARASARERTEAHRALIARLDPLAATIDATRPAFYLPQVDIAPRLAAVRAALEALERDARSSPAAGAEGRLWRLLGTGWAFVGDDRRAQPALERAAALTPDDSRVRADLGRLYLRRAQLEQLLAGWGQRGTQRAAPWLAKATVELTRALAGRGGLAPIEHAVLEATLKLTAGRQYEALGLALAGQRRFGEEPGSEGFWWIGVFLVPTARERLIQIDHAIERRPHEAWYHVTRSGALHALGRGTEARAALDRAIALNPYLAVAYINRVNMRRADDPEGALADARRAVELAPQIGLAHANLAMALLGLKRFDEALAVAARAAKLDPTLPQPSFHIAMVHRNRGQLKAALAAFDRSIAADPSYAESHIERAYVKRKLGDAAGADADLERALTLAPDHPIGRYRRATQRMQTGDADGAAADFEVSARGRPTYVPTLYHLGLIRHRQGKLTVALGWYSRALTVDPTFTKALNNRAVVYMRLGRRREALADFDRLVAAAPDQADSYLARGQLRMEMRQPAEALVDLDRAHQKGDRSPALRRARGYVLGQLGRHKEAIEELRRYLEHAPDDFQAWFYRARSLGKLGKLRETLANLERSRACAPPGEMRPFLDKHIASLRKRLGIAPTKD